MCARNTACVHIVFTLSVFTLRTLRTPIGSCSVLLGSVSQVRNVGCAGCALGGSIGWKTRGIGCRTRGIGGWVEVLGVGQEGLVVGAHYGGWKGARTIYAD